MIMIVVFISF